MTYFKIYANVHLSFPEFSIPNRPIFLSTLVKGKYSITTIILYSSWKLDLESQGKEPKYIQPAPKTTLKNFMKMNEFFSAVSISEKV